VRSSGTKAILLTVLSTVVATMGVTLTAAPAQAAPPSNDDIANAQVLAGPGIVTGTNVDATAEPGEPDHAGSTAGASVWYEWTSPDTVSQPRMQFWTRGSDFDTVLAVYSGGPVLTGLVEVGSNDDYGVSSGPSRVQFQPVRNTTYYIAVDGYFDSGTAATGSIRLRLSNALPEGSIDGAVTSNGTSGVDGICAVVVDDDGEPISLTGYTDASGYYILQGVPTGTDRHVKYWNCGSTTYAGEFNGDSQTVAGAADIVVQTGVTTHGVNAVLAEGGTLSGTVSADDPESVESLAGVCVTATMVGAPDDGFSRQATTDASGGYTIAGLDGGEYRIRFGGDCGPNGAYSAEYFDDATDAGDADLVTVTEGNTVVSVDAGLGAAPGAISGTARQWEAGPGIANICVRAVGPSYTSPSVDTDANGDYTIPNVPAGTDHIVRFSDCHASSNPYTTQWFNRALDVGDADAVAVTAGHTTGDIDASMFRAATLGGQITDPNGNPRDPACANVYTDEGAPVGSAQTGPDGLWGMQVPPGTYKIELLDCGGGGLSFETRWYLDATSQGSATTVVVDQGEVRTNLNQVLPGTPGADGRIVGRVTDDTAGQTPLDGICVTATRAGIPTETQSDATGRYEFGNLMPGTYTVYFHQCDPDADYNVLPQFWNDTDFDHATPVVVQDGTTTSGIVARMHPAGTIIGTVTDAGGDPIPDICVTVTPLDGSIVEAQQVSTDALGEYRVIGLSTRSYTVSFEDCDYVYVSEWYDGAPFPDGDPTPVPVVAGVVTDGIDAHLARYGTISGTVTNEAGDPLQDMCIIASADDGAFAFSAATDADGHYLVGALGDPASPDPVDYVVEFFDCSGVYGDEFYDNRFDFDSADRISVTFGQDTPGIDAVLQSVAPVNTTAPVINGITSVGETLTATNGAWDHEPSVFTYQWFRCEADGSGCVAADSGTDRTYLLTAGDAGHRFRVDVTAQNSKGSTAAASALTSPIDTLPPPNDDIADRQELFGSYPIHVSGTNVNATRQPGEPDHLGFAQGASVWYEWTAPTGPAALDVVQISLAGSTYDTTLSVYDGTPTPFSGLNLVADNDDWGLSQSQVDFAPVPGTTYYIAVDGFFNGTTVATGTIQLEISHSTGITGTVTNAEGDPIQGICVDAFDADQNIVGSDGTNASGEFEILGIPPGDYKVEYSDCDLVYVEEWYDDQPDFGSANDVHVTQGVITSGVDAELARYGTISGRWTDENGDPVYDQSCGAYAYDATTGDFAGSGFTNPDGYYTIGGLSTGTYVVDFSPCSVPFGEEWYDNKLTQAAATPVSVTFGQDTGDINVVLQDTAPVNTTPPSISGSASVGTTLTASPGDWDHEPSTYAYQWERCDAVGDNCDPINDAEGPTYLVTTGDLGSRLRVSVTATNSVGPGSATSALTDVVDDSPPPNDDIANLQALTGILPIDVTGSNVNATRQPGEPHHLGLPEGASVWYSWTAPTGGGAVDQVTISLGDSTFNTTLSVYDGSPSPFSALHLVAESDDYSSSTSQATFEPEPGTTYYIAVDGFFDGSVVSAGTIQMDLAPATGIAGIVTDADGDPVRDICATALPAGATGTPGQDNTAADGSYFIDLEPGSYYLDFSDCAQEYEEQFYDGVTEYEDATAVTVVANQVTPGIDAELVRLVNYGSISGTVTDDSGEPIPDICVTAFSDDVGVPIGEGTTDQNGTYLVRGLGDPDHPNDPVDYIVSYGDCSGVYGFEYYDNKLTSNDADPVPVNFDQTTPGIDAVLQSVAPVNTALPTVSGSTAAQSLLTATKGQWSHTPSTYGYQWRRCDATGTTCTDIPGANDPTYLTTNDDSGSTLRVRVSATNSIGSTTADSAATGLVGRPRYTALPVISGPPEIGATLSTTPGTWVGTSIGYTYQWQRCNAAGASCVAIGGAAGADYVISADDTGLRLRVSVTATNTAGTATVASATTTPIGRPANVTPPKITGRAEVGATLTTTQGTWTGNPTSYAYEWQRCTATCVAIGGAVNSTYVPTVADTSAKVRVQVTATNGLGSGTAASSTTTVIGLPAVVTKPAISGSLTVGSTLTTTTGTWTGNPTSYAYQWQRCDSTGANCVPLSGTDSPTYVTTVDDTDARLRVQVTASNTLGSGIAISATTTPVGRPANVTAPKITGRAEVGATLTTTQGTWTGNPTSYAYEWQRCTATCVAIGGAVSSTYVPTVDDTGVKLRAQVTATNGLGSGVAASSTTTPIGVPAVVTKPAITGALTVGATLTTSQGTWTGSPASYAYQWQRCDSAGANCVAIGGAINSTYVTTVDDTDARLRVQVTATNGLGSGIATSATTTPIGRPTIVTNPKITGLGGPELMVSQGTWTGNPTSYDYQWQRCDGAGVCDALLGASDPTYATNDDDTGNRLRVLVTATNGVGSTTVTIMTAAIGRPEVLTNPKITGLGDIGSTVTMSQGTWSGDPTSYDYQWQRCATSGPCVAIDGATGPTYLTTLDDAGDRLRVLLTVTNAVGSTTVSLTTATVGLPVVMTRPVITGTAAIAATLTASHGAWTGSPTSYEYQWQRCNASGTSCAAIADATDVSYSPTNDDIGARLRVLVVAVNALGSGAASGANPTRVIGAG
jgi:hypothetical protein